MGLLGFVLDILTSSDNSNSNDFVENESWFEHSGEEHDIEDGYCIECDDDEENLID